jgi:hypothetical protein
MTPAAILALINQQITSNGMGAITGPILNNILSLIVGLFTSVSPASKVVSASTTYTFLSTDVRVGFLRTLNLAATTVQLVAIGVGSEVIIQDLAGNFSAYPVTVLPPAGTTFSGGRTTYVMNEDNQTARFAFYGNNIFGVEPA